MKLGNISIPKEFFIEGSLALKRNVFLRKFLLLLNFFMLPLGIFWLFNDRTVLGYSLLLFLCTFNLNVFYAIKDRPFVIAYPIVMLTLSLTLFVAVINLGFSATLWTYPVVIALYFIIPLKQANLSNLVIVVQITLLVFFQYEFSLAIRYSASIAATIILGISLVNTIIELQTQLIKQSTTDPLTGAFNRRHMDNTLNKLVNQHNRSSHHAILMLDIDYFKIINDKFGHEAGDIALQDLVTLLKQEIRKTDALFRMGGEEFILLLRETTFEASIDIAESLRQSIEKVMIRDSVQNLTVSIGVAYLTKELSYSEWLKHADKRLYEAKRLGRNRVVSQIDSHAAVS